MHVIFTIKIDENSGDVYSYPLEGCQVVLEAIIKGDLPVKGETVRIKGDLYIVRDKYWDIIPQYFSDVEAECSCYIRLVKV